MSTLFFRGLVLVALVYACPPCLSQQAKPTRLEPFEILPAEGVHARPISFSHDGKLIAASSYDKPEIRLMDVKLKKTVARVKSSKAAAHVAFSKDGKYLATSGPREEPPCIWNTSDWSLYHEFTDCKVLTGRVYFAADSKIFAVYGPGSSLYLWDVKTKERIAEVKCEFDDLAAGILSPDGKMAAFASKNGEVELIDVASRKRRARWQAHDEPVALSFSPDGKSIASCGWSARAGRLWKSADGALLQTLITPNRFQSFAHMDFSPDGRWVGIAADWPTMPIFDAKTGRQAFELAGSKYQLEWITFSPDSGTVAASSRDGAILLWRLPKAK